MSETPNGSTQTGHVLGWSCLEQYLDRPRLCINSEHFPASIEKGPNLHPGPTAEIDHQTPGAVLAVGHRERSLEEGQGPAPGRPLGEIGPGALGDQGLAHESNLMVCPVFPRITFLSRAWSTYPGDVKFNVVTMFPEFFRGPLDTSIVARGLEDGILEVELHDLREHGLGRHRQLDDTPFGGGPGMVMMIEPLAAALQPLEGTHRVLFTPSGNPMKQETLDRWASLGEITLVCGRYEGVDQRVVDHFIDEEVSLGDYVLAGGEVAAAVAIEGVARLLPGVVGNPESTEKESFRDGLLEEPVYTRPAGYRGWEVPEVLLSGDHGRIEEWRIAQRLRRTSERRPDLLTNGEESDT